MNAEMWHREEILHVLVAADAANTRALARRLAAPAIDPQTLCAYQEGYRAALYSVAAALGLSLADAAPTFAHRRILMPLQPLRRPRLTANGEEG